MSVNINQFAQTPTKGQADLSLNPNTLGCQVTSDEATALVPGQAVKLVDSLGGVPKVTAVTADTDDIFGVVLYNVKNATFPALQALEVAAQDNVVYMEASAAIARGAKVMYVVTGQKVATATAGKTVVGFAFDKATASGDLIRVYLLTFSGVANVNFSPAAFVAQVSTANATDLATAEALANQLKTSVNAILTSLINAGVMLSS